MQRISVNVTNNRDGNQFNYNNDLPAIRNKNYELQKPFETDFFTVLASCARFARVPQTTILCTKLCVPLSWFRTFF